MPVHWPTVYRQLEGKLQLWSAQQQRQSEHLRAALDVLARWATRGEELAARVRALLAADGPLAELGRRHRFAWPLASARWDVGQCPDAAAPGPEGCPHPTAMPPGEVWAADGSQITPDRHAAVLFGLVNVAVVRMQPGHTPQVFTRSWLLLEPDLEAALGDEREFVAALRDVYEVRTLSQSILAAEDRQPPTFAWVDGPLELWRQGAAPGEARRAYAEALHQLLAAGVWPAGYVDRPRSAMLVHTLALLDLEQQGRLQPSVNLKAHWPGLSDAALWAHLLQPGQRSPLFRLWTPLPPEGVSLPLAFFYLRLPRGRGVARVDVPAAMAEHPAALDALHAQFWYQVHIIPDRLYPYLLLRAHEEALVTYQERRALEAYLQRRWAEQSGQAPLRSAKQRAKDTTAHRGRARR